MTRKERLMATLRGEKTDRPPVCFYELNGLTEDETDPDPFNIYNHPSWKRLLELTRAKTDRIVMCYIPFVHEPGAVEKVTKKTSFYDEEGRKHEITEIQMGDRTLRQHTRRDMDVNTTWILEHFIKDEEDLEAWISFPDEECGEPDYREALHLESKLGDTGIIMIETGDALCEVASLMDMEDYMVIAMTEPELFHRALEKAHRNLMKRAERIAEDLPGRLWRIYGPEYAAPPYLPPSLYKEYVTDYDRELVEVIQKKGGFARIHQHGRQKDILDYTVQTGCSGLDPVEPVPQGDVTLSYVRENYGKQLVLFGNLEFCDLELLGQEEFEKKVEKALAEGMKGDGRGFVLMPSACPLGRIVADNTIRNYEKMIEVVERL
ncbi:MAG: uroporphyrinogen decarboxylase family protein [Muricomes sp.]|uniref:uroporphyrinogen decarboxylase family protein n=1 Tax=Faecalicatena contorta TaxID=39482 RepID=UPI002EB1750E|nr:uroporphyrinogen decarboxylase family protein [Muricomes sp.]